MKILPVLFALFVLEALSTLMWFVGSLGMAMVSFFLLGGESQGSLALLWPLFGIWMALFAPPAILQMVRNAVWIRGLAATEEDIKKWSKSLSTELLE